MSGTSNDTGDPGHRPHRSAGGTSPSLLMRVRARDAAAWGRLVDLYAPLVHHWCRRAQLTPEDTADVFQEVFRSVAQSIERFHRDRPGDTFRGWLRIITSNKIHDLRRHSADQPRAAGGTDAQVRLHAVADPLEADASEADLIHRQVHATLEAIRPEFEERTWQAFWRVQMDGLSSPEAAAELGMTDGAVRKAKLRVLRRLREELGELLG